MLHWMLKSCHFEVFLTKSPPPPPTSNSTNLKQTLLLCKFFSWRYISNNIYFFRNYPISFRSVCHIVVSFKIGQITLWKKKKKKVKIIVCQSKGSNTQGNDTLFILCLITSLLSYHLAKKKKKRKEKETCTASRLTAQLQAASESIVSPLMVQFEWLDGTSCLHETLLYMYFDTSSLGCITLSVH